MIRIPMNPLILPVLKELWTNGYRHIDALCFNKSRLFSDLICLLATAARRKGCEIPHGIWGAVSPGLFSCGAASAGGRAVHQRSLIRAGADIRANRRIGSSC